MAREGPSPDIPPAQARNAIPSNRKGMLDREEKRVYIHYGKSSERFDMEQDPKQYSNLVNHPEDAKTRAKLKTKLSEIHKNDLGISY
ncbi:MAG: hypothetical protein VCG02_04260 [Verrucomicrobiota bacterium]